VAGKTALIVAPIIVGGAALWLAFWLGRLFERARRRTAAAHISPELHGELVDLVRDVLSPGDTIDDVAYLPTPMRDRAKELLSRAEKNAIAVSRAQQRASRF
jgi:hypothetical protein